MTSVDIRLIVLAAMVMASLGCATKGDLVTERNDRIADMTAVHLDMEDVNAILKNFNKRITELEKAKGVRK